MAATLAAWRSAGALADEGQSAPLPPAPPPPDRAARFAQAYTFDGRAIRIEVDDPSLAAALHPLLAPLEASALGDPPAVSGVIRAVEAPDGGFVVHLGGGRFRRAADPDLALGEIINALIDLMHPGARWLAIIHASAVVAAGGALVMTAPSGSGKSTLCAALTASGHRYMSDDVVPIAADGMAYPVPLAQSLKRGSWRVLGEWLPGLPDVDAAPPDPGIEHHRAVGSALTALGPARVAAFLVRATSRAQHSSTARWSRSAPSPG